MSELDELVSMAAANYGAQLRALAQDRAFQQQARKYLVKDDNGRDLLQQVHDLKKENEALKQSLAKLATPTPAPAEPDPQPEQQPADNAPADNDQGDQTADGGDANANA